MNTNEQRCDTQSASSVSGAGMERVLRQSYARLSVLAERAQRGAPGTSERVVHCTADELLSLFATMDVLRARVTELENLNGMDELTGIANRRGLMRQLHEHLQRARRGAHFALAIVDIDHFKRINDSHGHATGDDVLAAIAQALVRSCRQTDFVARLGGEEFCALYEGATLEAAQEVAERQRQVIERLGLDAGSVTVSIGLAECRSHDSCETLLARADAALYRAKEAGRNLIRTAA